MESRVLSPEDEHEMGSRLLDAASRGDVEYVRSLYDKDDDLEDPDLSPLIYSDSNGRNLLHAAVEEDRYTFLFEVLDILSLQPTLVIKAICQQATYGNTLHYAVGSRNYFIIQLLINAYTKAVSAVENNQETLPWLAKNSFEQTPLRRSLEFRGDRYHPGAKYLVSVDDHFFKTLGHSRYPIGHSSTQVLDDENRSILFIAMRKGLSQLVKQILTSDLPYELINGVNGQTLLHNASICNEEVSRILLEKHPELIKEACSSGKTMLDCAIEFWCTWLVRLMLTEEKGWTKACQRLIWHKNKNGDTPLHMAAERGRREIIEILIQCYQSFLQEDTEYRDREDALPEPGNDLIGTNLFNIENSRGDIPLIVALRNKYDDCGLILSEETVRLSVAKSIFLKSLPIAIENGCLLSAKKILERVLLTFVVLSPTYYLKELGIRSPIVLSIARRVIPRGPLGKPSVAKATAFENLLGVLPRFVGVQNEKDSKTILKEAVERGENWFVRLALESDKGLVTESAPAWQLACKNGNKPLLLMFIELCDHDKFIEFCRETKQTPLHHIQLLEFEQYVELLKLPVFEKLMNQVDSDEATPLHRAIDRHDIGLTKALLASDGIEISIKDKNGMTALDLLENKSGLSTSWHEQHIGLLKKPGFKKLLNQQRDEDKTTPLHRAIERHDFEMTKALLAFDGIKINIKDTNGKTAFDLLENNLKVSTSWLEQYIKLLKKAAIDNLLNQRDDEDGTTPLHRAIQRDDLELTKALLETKGIEVNINDNNRRTALDLLQKSCGLSPMSWGKMCRDIKQDSTVKKLKFLFRKIAFEGMQNTISVVAALVATITFAAGFTVPGGTDSNNGTPMLATTAAFLAFSISNTIAMCCSIMVLFILLGPMMWDPHPSLFYVNLSLSLLLMSLVGTVVAFMTGLYATMAAKAKWNAIFVVAVCSLALSMAGIVLMLTYWPQVKKLPGKAYNTTVQEADAPIVAMMDTAPKPAPSLNTHVAQTSPNLNLEVGQSSGDHKIEIKSTE